MNSIPLIRLQIILVATAACASAQVAILTYSWDGASPGQSPTILSASAVQTAGDFTAAGTAVLGRTTGVSFTNLAAGTVGSPAGFVTETSYTAGTANANVGNANGFGTLPTAANWVGFTFTMSATRPADFSALHSFAIDLANAGTSGPRGFEVTYRVGGIGAFTSLGIAQVPNNTANNFGRFTFTPESVVLLGAGDVVEFRLLGFANATNNSIRFDNATVFAAIPEPGTVALLTGLAALLWTVAVRRRRD
jgi:hypothetical protein